MEDIKVTLLTKKFKAPHPKYIGAEYPDGYSKEDELVVRLRVEFTESGDIFDKSIKLSASNEASETVWNIKKQN